MKVQILGSSDAFNGAGRCHASYLLTGAGLPSVAVDFGATGLLALRKAGVSQRDLDAVVITHLHGDHYGGLPFLILDAMYAEPRARPLTLVGPPGFEARLVQLFRALYVDLWDKPRPFELKLIEMQPGEELALGAWSLRASRAEHMDPPDVPLCLRFTAFEGTDRQRVIAFSGDTEPCDGLREVAAGADLLVAECTGLTPPCGRHIAWSQWRELFGSLVRSLAVRRVVLSHLGSDVRSAEAELLAEVPGGVSLIFADDGQVHDL